jgi:hypothetical protein
MKKSSQNVVWINNLRNGSGELRHFFGDNSCQKIAAIICWPRAVAATATSDVHVLAQAMTKRLMRSRFAHLASCEAVTQARVTS